MSFKRHLMAFDMDGTLLTDKDKIILEETKQLLKELKEAAAWEREKAEGEKYYEKIQKELGGN